MNWRRLVEHSSHKLDLRARRITKLAICTTDNSPNDNSNNSDSYITTMPNMTTMTTDKNDKSMHFFISIQ